MGGVKENNMAERLTKKINKTIQDKYSLGSYLYYDFAEIDNTNKLLNKLGELEDILEKYGVESVEELSNALEFATVIEKTLSDYGIQNNEELEELLDDNKYAQNVVVKQLVELQNAKNEENTWKRACELACKWFKQTGFIGDQTEVDYYYQQAKKEGENK